MLATALTQTGCFDVQERAATFQANNEKNGFGVSALSWGGGTGLGGSHTSISGSPVEEVARDLLVKSTAFLTETIATKNLTERIAVKATDVSVK
jgi:curli biogenesis system outer membrane secretion channel CsgG